MQSHASKCGRTLNRPLLGHLKILHTLIGTGSAAFAAAVPYPAKVTQIPHKGQWNHKDGEKRLMDFKLCTLLVVFKLHTHRHECTHACMHACTYAPTQTHPHIHTHMRMYTQTHMHAFTHFQSPTHTHTHECMGVPVQQVISIIPWKNRRCLFIEYSLHHCWRAENQFWQTKLTRDQLWFIYSTCHCFTWKPVKLACIRSSHRGHCLSACVCA